MLTLTYRSIVTTPLMPALRNLRAQRLDSRTAYRVMKIFQAVSKHYLESMQAFETKGAEVGERDENGALKKYPNGQHIVKAENEVSYKEWLDKFLDTNFVVEQHPVSLGALGTITPEELEALEPILDSSETQMMHMPQVAGL